MLKARSGLVKKDLSSAEDIAVSLLWGPSSDERTSRTAKLPVIPETFLLATLHGCQGCSSSQIQLSKANADPFMGGGIMTGLLSLKDKVKGSMGQLRQSRSAEEPQNLVVSPGDPT